MADDSDNEDGSLPSKYILELAHKEAQRTVDDQIQTLNDIDTKAAKILRLDVVLISIVLTGVSITLQSPNQFPRLDTIVNLYTMLGTALLLISAALAALTYTASTSQVGVSDRDINKMLTSSDDYSDLQIVDGLVASYAEWIRFNNATNINNSLYI